MNPGSRFGLSALYPSLRTQVIHMYESPQTKIFLGLMLAALAIPL
jgi:hypothetical protein